MWQGEIDKWFIFGAKWLLDFFLLFEPSDDEKFPFVFVVANGAFFRGLHALAHLFCLKPFVIFFNGLAFGPFFSSFLRSFLPELFTDLPLAF